ncbi:MAG: hypothetical protein QM586_07510 [Xenophilus sp.]
MSVLHFLRSEAASYRLGVASRVLAAALGGHALISALAVLPALPLSWWWPMPRGQAVQRRAAKSGSGVRMK